MISVDFDYYPMFVPIFAAIMVRTFAEYLLLTADHPIAVAFARALKSAALPFAVAIFAVLITAQIQS